MNKTSVLIIEDDQDTVEAMKLTLESQDYIVNVSYDPEDGFSKALSEEPSVIILDVMFGKDEKSSGFECALKMKQSPELAKIPILMVTAINIHHPNFGFSPDTDEEYLPVDDFIDKPAQPKDLLEKVARLASGKVSKWKNWPDLSE